MPGIAYKYVGLIGHKCADPQESRCDVTKSSSTLKHALQGKISVRDEQTL